MRSSVLPLQYCCSDAHIMFHICRFVKIFFILSFAFSDSFQVKMYTFDVISLMYFVYIIYICFELVLPFTEIDSISADILLIFS